MRAITYVKMVAAGGICCIGGPALVMYVSPTEEELFQKYNPELQKRSLERRQEKQEELNEFVAKLKAYSKDTRPIWTVWEEDVARKQAAAKNAELERRREEQRMRDEIKGSIK